MDFVLIRNLYPHLNKYNNSEINYLVVKNQTIIKNYQDFQKKYKNFDIKIYYNFNKDLQSLNKYQLLKHWVDFGQNEIRIHSEKSFFLNIQILI